MAVEIPKQGWAGIVVNEGPNFHVEVGKLDVPEPSKSLGQPTKGQTSDSVQRTMSC